MEPRKQDDAFTLIELLIVIVILGVLSTVTVIAIRGVTEEGEQSVCQAELRSLATAQEQHRVLFGSYGDESDLVSNEVILSDSPHYEIAIGTDDSYTISPAADSNCTGSTSGGGGSNAAGPPTGGPDRSGYTISLADLQAANNTFVGFDSLEYNGSGGANEILIFGRAEGQQDFVDMVNASPATSRRITFVHVDEFVDSNDILTAMGASRNNGFTTFALYPDDDGNGSVQSFVSGQIGVGTNSSQEEFVLLDVFGGPNQTLLELVNSIG